MAADADDYFQKVSRSTATTLSAPGYTIGNTTINVGSTANWGDSTGVTFAIDEVDSDGVRVSGTYNVFRGVVSSATQISDLTYVGGDPNRDYTAGATTRVYILVSAYRDNRLVDGLLVSHDQDGTLKAGAVDNAAVLATDVVETAKIKDLNVTTAKIADEAVTGAKIDFAATGAGGIWWEEIGRTTLGSAGDTITVSSLPPRKHLMIITDLIATGGTISLSMTFNGDTGNNYAVRVSVNNATDTTAASQAALNTHVIVAAYPQRQNLFISNIETQEKIGFFLTNSQNTAGAANIPGRAEGAVKWANTSAQISSVTITNSGTGDYAIGSEVIVLGHD